jgi:hypothetical protein
MIKVQNITADTKKCLSCLTNTAKVRYTVSNGKYDTVLDLCFPCNSLLHDMSAPVTNDK